MLTLSFSAPISPDIISFIRFYLSNFLITSAEFCPFQYKRMLAENLETKDSRNTRHSKRKALQLEIYALSIGKHFSTSINEAAIHGEVCGVGKFAARRQLFVSRAYCRKVSLLAPSAEFECYM